MKSEKIDLSVIIPVYNKEKYLEEAVSSVLKQVSEQTEIILVDDGSPDSCGTICDRLAQKDKRVIVIHQQNQGEGYARNAGLEYSRGKWISFVDADDVVSNDFFRYFIEYKSEEDDLLIFEMCLHDKENIATRMIDEIEKKFAKKEIKKIVQDTFRYSALEENRAINLRSVCGRFFKREFLESHNLCFGKAVIGADMLFMLEVYMKCKSIRVVNKIIYQCRFINETSITHQYKPNMLDIVCGFNQDVSVWVVKYPEFMAENATYQLNYAIWFMKYDWFHKENVRRKSDNIEHVDTCIKGMDFDSKYEIAKRSGLLKWYNLPKRIVFLFVKKRKYHVLHFISRIKFYK